MVPDLERKRLMLGTYIIKFVILLLISVILVAGFWFHTMFYQYGLIPLLAVGGAVTLLIIIVTSKTLSFGSVLKPRPKGEVEFTRDEKKAIISGSKNAHLSPFLSGNTPRLGLAYSATSGGERFATLHITDLRRILISDIAEDDLSAAGFASRSDFENRWGGCSLEGKDSIANLFRFDVDLSREGA
jgi:hypothetical protein